VHPSSPMHLARDSSGSSHAVSRQRLDISCIYEQSRSFSSSFYLHFYSILPEISLLLQTKCVSWTHDANATEMRWGTLAAAAAPDPDGEACKRSADP